MIRSGKRLLGQVIKGQLVTFSFTDGVCVKTLNPAIHKRKEPTAELVRDSAAGQRIVILFGSARDYRVFDVRIIIALDICIR